MPILGRLYTPSTVCSVFGFHKTLLLSILGCFILMDFATCLEHLSQDYDLGHGVFLFASFKEVTEVFGLFLLLVFGLKSLYSPWCSWGLVQFICGLGGKSGKLKNGFCAEQEKVVDGDIGPLKDVPSIGTLEESPENSGKNPGSDREPNRDLSEEYDDDESQAEEDDESDVWAIRKLVKIERRKAKAAAEELVKERAASATAAEEAMAMILRLQSEKSSIEMESSQYRRLAEEKQIHDQQVIESLRWLVWRSESEMSLLQEELNRLLKSRQGDIGLEEQADEETPSCLTMENEVDEVSCLEDALSNI